MKTLQKNIKDTQIFFDSDIEMFKELDRTEKMYKNGKIKILSFEEFFNKSQKRIKTLSI